jgi:hypothetical protein
MKLVKALAEIGMARSGVEEVKFSEVMKIGDGSWQL